MYICFYAVNINIFTFQSRCCVHPSSNEGAEREYEGIVDESTDRCQLQIAPDIHQNQSKCKRP